MPFLHVRDEEGQEHYLNIAMIEAFLEDDEPGWSMLAMPRGVMRVQEDLHDIHKRVTEAERRSSGALTLLDTATVS